MITSDLGGSINIIVSKSSSIPRLACSFTNELDKFISSNVSGSKGWREDVGDFDKLELFFATTPFPSVAESEILQLTPSLGDFL